MLPTPSSATAPRPLTPHLLLTLLAGAVFFTLHLPALASSFEFLLADAGASLKLDLLLDSGLRPGVDFGYSYGPLSAVVSQLGYSLLGRTAPAHLILVALLSVGALTGLARCMAHLENGWTGLVMAVIFAQPLVRSFGFNLTYASEAACLLHALAFHLQGRRDRALMLAVLAALVKPSMGILYSGLLAVWILRASGLRAAWAQLRPAAITAAVALGICVAGLGFQSTLRTAIPLSGVAHYGALAPPLTKFVRTLAAPEGVNFKYYLGTLAGFWLLASALLLLGALRSLRGALEKSPRAEVAVTCAMLHVAFVTLFFGPWQTYLGLLIVGLFCGVDRQALRWGLVAAAVLGSKQMTTTSLEGWRERSLDARLLGGTWVRQSERQELDELVRIAGPRPLYFLTTGYPEGAFPGSRGTQSWFVVPGMLRPPEQDAILRDVRTAPVVAVGKVQGWGPLEFDWVRQALSGYTLVRDGELFTVYVSDSASPQAD